MGGGAQRVYEGAGAHLLSVAVSPGGDLLAAVGENGTAVLFDVARGAIRQRLEGHTGDVTDVAFNPEGAWLVTGGDDRQIIRWSLPTADAPAEQLQAWEAPGAVHSVAVSPDGRLLATGGMDNAVSLWKAETGELVHRLQGHESLIAPNGGLAFSPSGHSLASASYDRTARVWDVQTGKSLRIFGGHSDVVTGVVFAGDDSQIATISGQNDRRAALWDVGSDIATRVLAGHANGVFGVGYVARGVQPEAANVSGQEARPLLVTSSFDRTLRIWDTETGVTLRIFEGHLSGVNRLALHTANEPGAKAQLFSASHDGTVRRWDMAPLQHQRLLDVPGEAKAAAIAPDGMQVAVGFDDGSIRLYELPVGRLVDEVEDAHGATIKRLVFNADGGSLASAGFDNNTKLWSVSGDGELTAQQTFTGHHAHVHGVAFSPDGKTLATASYDGSVGSFQGRGQGRGAILRC